MMPPTPASFLQPSATASRARRFAQQRIRWFRDRLPSWTIAGGRAATAPHRSLNILYAPGFKSLEEFEDPFYRLAWYAHPILPGIARVSAAASFTELPSGPLPDYLDPQIAELAPQLGARVDLFPSNRIDLWRDRLEAADIVLNWREGLDADDAVGNLLRRSLPRKKVWRVDPQRTRFEGSFHLYFSHDADPDREGALELCRSRFTEFRAGLPHTRKGYVFGTGPSLAQAFTMDFSDGVTFACNSMVKNRELLSHLRPSALVFADPIFHAGCSSYAADFRRDLVRAVDDHDIHLIVPFRDFKLYSANLPPHVASRLIGVPLQPLDRPNMDLAHRFEVKSVGNVLTLLLLPLACTLFDEIGIVGCDGRLDEESSYFWSHDRQSQFTERMEDIRQCHPAFFAIDYNQYYSEHRDNLDLWLRSAEAKGVSVRNLTRSYIPALKERSALAPRPPRRHELSEKRIALIDPDLRSGGHTGSFARNAAEIFSRLAAEVLVFEGERSIEATAGQLPDNVHLVQIPPSLLPGKAQPAAGPSLALHLHDLWKFVEDHDVDHLVLLSEGYRREMYATMPVIPYSVVVHTVWSLLKSISHPRLGVPIRQAIGQARALFVVEEYLGEPLRPLCPRVLQLPCGVYHGSESTMASANSNGMLRLGTIGVVGENRNIDFLLRALAHYSGPPIRYYLGGKPAGSSGEKAAELVRNLEIPPTVEFRSDLRYLNEQEYATALADLDYLLLGYDEARELQGSAAVYSAARYGTPVIAPRVRPFTTLAERYPAMFELYMPLDAKSLQRLLVELAESKRGGGMDRSALAYSELERFRSDHSIGRVTERLRRDLSGVL